MPQTCPHCGAALTGVVDAFCPECREELSAPEEPIPVVLPVSEKARRPAPPPGAALETAYGGCVTLIFGAGAIGVLGQAVADNDWRTAALATVVLAGCVAWFVGLYRGPTVKTQVTGTAKTSKSPEQPK